MTCGLDQEELDILRYLVKGRCLSHKHTISIKAIERDLGNKIPDLEGLLDRLMVKRYLGCKKKNAKYYYAQASDSIRALTNHGMETWRGGRGRL